MTKGGSLQRFSALVVVGNGDGVVGWASGKAPEVGAAVDKAYSRASRKLFYFERFEGHTLWHGATGRYGRSKVDLGPLPSGSGLRANQTARGGRGRRKGWRERPRRAWVMRARSWPTRHPPPFAGGRGVPPGWVQGASGRARAATARRSAGTHPPSPGSLTRLSRARSLAPTLSPRKTRQDVRAKVHGSHNPQTTLRAVFEALDAIRRARGAAAATEEKRR